MALIDDARFTARMCGKIMSYWYEQGHPEVEAKPILVPLKAGGQTWGIKSNLVNGLPPSKVSVPMARAA